jgi:uncharacterized membrane protein YebE (DUF533 family)
MQSGVYQVTPEWLKEEIAAERKAIQDKIDALGLRKEYELWLKNYITNCMKTQNLNK